MEGYQPRQHRKYDEQFRLRVMDYHHASGKSVRQVALEFDIPWKTLARWIYMSKRKSRSSGKQPELFPEDPKQLQDEIRRLRREKAHLEEQCEILKKAIAICSTDPRFRDPSR